METIIGMILCFGIAVFCISAAMKLEMLDRKSKEQITEVKEVIDEEACWNAYQRGYHHGYSDGRPAEAEIIDVTNRLGIQRR